MASPGHDGDSSRRLYYLDMLMNFLLITPFVILCWHGTYALAAAYVFPEDPFLNAVAVLVFAVVLEFVASYYHDVFPRWIVPTSVMSSLGARAYIYLLGLGNILHWYGLDMLYVMYFGSDWDWALTILGTTVVLLWSMRCGRNIVSPPLCVSLDHNIDAGFYQCSTLFKSQVERSVKKCLDSLSTVIFVPTVVCIHWHAFTVLLDILLFPDDKVMSILASLVLGYTTVFTFIAAERPGGHLSTALEKYSVLFKIGYEDIFILVANFGAISVWKGWTMLFDMMSESSPIMYGDQVVTPWVTHTASFLVLAFAMASGTLAGKGCDWDGEIAGGDGVKFCTDYFREFYKDTTKKAEEETKKTQ